MIDKHLAQKGRESKTVPYKDLKGNVTHFTDGILKNFSEVFYQPDKYRTSESLENTLTDFKTRLSEFIRDQKVSLPNKLKFIYSLDGLPAKSKVERIEGYIKEIKSKAKTFGTLDIYFSISKFKNGIRRIDFANYYFKAGITYKFHLDNFNFNDINLRLQQLSLNLYKYNYLNDLNNNITDNTELQLASFYHNKLNNVNKQTEDLLDESYRYYYNNFKNTDNIIKKTYYYIFGKYISPSKIHILSIIPLFKTEYSYFSSNIINRIKGSKCPRIEKPTRVLHDSSFIFYYYVALFLYVFLYGAVIFILLIIIMNLFRDIIVF